MYEINDITDFLPQYPDIDQQKNPLLNPYEDENFNLAIYKKKEFYDLKLDKQETIINKPGELYNHQKIISRFFSSHTDYDQLLLLHEMGCLDPSTDILLWNGQQKQAKDIVMGDILVGDDGTPRTVRNIIKGVSDMYEIDPGSMGKEYRVNSNHILSLYIKNNYCIYWHEDDSMWELRWFDKQLLRVRSWTQSCNLSNKEEVRLNVLKRKSQIKSHDNMIDISVLDYISIPNVSRSYLVPLKAKAIKWEQKKVPFDPYVFGTFIASTNKDLKVTSFDSRVIDIWNGWIEKSIISLPKFEINTEYCLKDILLSANFSHDDDTLQDCINDYIVNSQHIRSAFLAGIIDVSNISFYSEKQIEFNIRNYISIECLEKLIRSLGLGCSTRKDISTITLVKYNSEHVSLPLTINSHISDILRTKSLSEMTVKYVGQGPYIGWELDKNKRFTLGDYTVTHNTGKSCSAVAALEGLKDSGKYKGALYLAKGEALINNFINEIIMKCTDGKYIPEDYESLTKLEKIHRKKKNISSFYKFDTFEVFAKKVKVFSESTLRDMYRGYIIVIDEVHNIRIQDEVKRLNVYNEIFRFLHSLEDCKVLLMSGTPMKDKIFEISSVMNLILPTSQQFPNSEELFLKEYFNQDNRIYKLKPSMKETFQERFKGRVSFLLSMPSEVKKVYEGEKIGSLRMFNVVPGYMSKFQGNSYIRAYIEDRKGENFSLNSRQASLFVFPDGSYGEKGFEKYVKKLGNYFVLSAEMQLALKGNSIDEKLAKLKSFSITYYKSVQNILRAREEGKNVFVYNKLVSGSGIVLFGLILQLFGFSRSVGNDKDKQNRYAILTSNTNPSTISSILELYNRKDNLHGDYISVILGSTRVSEGISLLNIQVEDIQTPWYNYADIAQAIARGIRLGSHRSLLDEDKNKTIEVEISQRVALPPKESGIPSIDLQMYEIAELKDINIKNVERVIKEIAFDCALNYDRNYRANNDGSRECEYQNCNYTCVGIPQDLITNKIPNSDLDYSTYQLYYNSEQLDKIGKRLAESFQLKFQLSMGEIIQLFNDYKFFEILSALRNIIDQNLVIYNKYGLKSYLREQNNFYFLSNRISAKDDLTTVYYTENLIAVHDKSFRDIYYPIYYSSLSVILKKALVAKDQIVFNKLIKQLPLQIQNVVLEMSIPAPDSQFRTRILELYKNEITQNEDGSWTSKLYPDEEGRISYLGLNEDGTYKNWEYISPKKKSTGKSSGESSGEPSGGDEKYENSKYGYYGILYSDGKFNIRDVTVTKYATGKNCTSWDTKFLRHLILVTLKIPYPDNEETTRFLERKYKSDLDNPIELAKSLKSKFNKETFDNLPITSPEIANNYLYWGAMSVKEMCAKIQNFFEEEDLLLRLVK